MRDALKKNKKERKKAWKLGNNINNQFLRVFTSPLKIRQRVKIPAAEQ